MARKTETRGPVAGLGRDISRKAAPTALDVARLAGVSQSAVSRAFTKGASISAHTRAKVEAAARHLGYRPNLIARSLITRRSNLVGVVMGYMLNPFYSEALQGLLERLHALGYRTLLFSADASQPTDILLDEIMHSRVDALILASVSLSSTLAAECRAAGVPVVLFNRKTTNIHVASVTGDNTEGAAKIATYLAAAGHRRFAFMAGLESSSTSRDREAGFSDWLRENMGITPARVVGNYDFEEARQATRKLFAEQPDIDALFCANDHMAFGALETVRAELGKSVGHDLSIVGFDDVTQAAWPSFGLTTFSQPVNTMLAHTVDLMEGMLGDPHALPQSVIVPGQLILRSSSRPI